MIGDKIKQFLENMRRIEGYDVTFQTKELEKLIEKANRVDELEKEHKTDIKLIELATKMLNASNAEIKLLQQLLEKRVSNE